METERQHIHQASGKPIIQFIVFLSVTLAVPAGLVHMAKPPLLEERHAKVMRNNPAAERARLAAENPDWLLIGNSMLNTRINQEDMSRVSGMKALKLTEGGSQSSIWFLFLKRIVLESGAKPKWITIFFRETDLTWADLRIGGSNAELINLLDGQAQPEWRQVITNRSLEGKVKAGDLKGFASQALAAALDADEWRIWGRGRLQYAAFEATEFGGGMPHHLRRVEMNERFSLDHLRHDLASDTAGAGNQAGIVAPDSAGDSAVDVGIYETGPKVFDGSPQASFLPHIIAVAKQTGARVHFHRVKLRSRVEGGSEDSAWMQAYMKDLRRYLEAEGCALTDESDDPEITRDLYADGDHISREPTLQRRYIDLFWKRVGPVIAGGAPAKETQGIER